MKGSSSDVSAPSTVSTDPSGEGSVPVQPAVTLPENNGIDMADHPRFNPPVRETKYPHQKRQKPARKCMCTGHDDQSPLVWELEHPFC